MKSMFLLLVAGITIGVSLYFLGPPVCQMVMNIFETHCGTGEKFFGAVPFSSSAFGFGILLLIYFFKSKFQPSGVIRK